MISRLFSIISNSSTMSRCFSICSSSLPGGASFSQPGGAWGPIFNRTNVRNHFPRAKETKRVRTHGWEKRLSTEGGRRIIMRRLLKGRHVLTH